MCNKNHTKIKNEEKLLKLILDARSKTNSGGALKINENLNL